MTHWNQRLLVMVLGFFLGVGGSIVADYSSSGTATFRGENYAPTTLASDIKEDNLAPNSVNNSLRGSPTIYHLALQKGFLSIIEGGPGENSRVVYSGLNVRSWPSNMLELAPTVEFHSLEEVQFFIDSVSEFLHQE